MESMTLLPAGRLPRRIHAALNLFFYDCCCSECRVRTSA